MNSTLRRAALALVILASLTACKPAADGAPKTDVAAATAAPDAAPTSGIDLAGMKMFYDMISQLRLNYDLSILLVSHDLQAVAGVADRMIYLNQTVVCDGSPWDVLSDKRLREAFGLDVSVEDLPVFNKKNIHEMRTTNG